MKYVLIVLFQIITIHVFSQQIHVTGRVYAEGKPLPAATITVNRIAKAVADSNGYYTLEISSAGNYQLTASGVGYESAEKKITIKTGVPLTINFNLTETHSFLDEVIVTGVSKATELRKNPVPIAVIGKREMNTNVNANIIDAIIKGVPGVTALTTGPNISKPVIRGLGYNRVLTMYDGIRQEGQQWGDEHSIEIDQYGIERAEVVKGPASLTYGSDATAGVINLIPALPNGIDGKLKGDAILDYQTNNGMMAASVGLSYKKNDWKYAFRATAKQAHDYQNKIDGFVYNTGYKEFNLSSMIRVDKRWGFSQVSATLYDNLQEIPDGSRDSLTRKFTKQVSDAADDIKARPLVSNQELKEYTIAPLHQHIQHYRLYSHNKINIGSGNIQATLAYQQSVRREFTHPTAPAQAGLYIVLNTVNYHLKYDFPKWNGYEITAGVNGMHQNNKNKNATDFPIPDYSLFDAGMYVFAKKNFGKVDISGGIRYDSRNLKWDDFYVRNNAATGFDEHVLLPDTAGAKNQFTKFSKQFTGVTGSIGIAYNITERIVLKANIARGYRSPNINETGSNGLDPGAHIVYLGNRNFTPEFSLQQDIGLIAYLKDIDVSVELFNNNIDGYIYQSKLYDANGQPVVIVTDNVTYQYQQSKAHLYGGELTLNLHPQKIKWLSFNNSVSYVTGLNKNDALLKMHGNKAKYLPFIPPLQYRTQLKFTDNDIKGIFSKSFASIGMDVFAAQNRFYSVDDTETFTPAYSLINLGLGTTIVNKQGKALFQLFAQANNLFDVAYQSNQNRLKYFEYYNTSPNNRYGIYNMGRNISVKLVVAF